MQLVELTTILKVKGARVGERKSPASLVLVCPIDGSVQVALQVNDRFLTACVAEVLMIAAAEQVEHHRSWAEVKGDALADAEAGMRVKPQEQPALLDIAHPNHGA